MNGTLKAQQLLMKRSAFNLLEENASRLFSKTPYVVPQEDAHNALMINIDSRAGFPQSGSSFWLAL